MDNESDRLIVDGFFFSDREHAGAVLADHLRSYRDRDVLVLGIPRGGVIVAAEVARRLHGDLDVIVARKLRAPDRPELAIGAVTADDGVFVNEALVHQLGVTKDYLKEERSARMQEAQKRQNLLRGSLPPPAIRDRTVILVDDGLATGATMRAAVRSVRWHHPARLVVAVPVGTRDASLLLREEADQFVCPYFPARFYAVGQFYNNFAPVGDEHVREVLEEFHAAIRVQR
jgi:putative phosphoribosyl transferase